MFLDLIELPDQKAEIIFKHLLECFVKRSFDDPDLKQHLIVFACDGASVMLDNKSSAAYRLLENYPFIIIWHYLIHSLELAVGVSVRS